MAATVTQFRNRIIPFVPKCPIPTIDLYVVDAMRQLCEETNCFTKVIGATGNAPSDEFPFVFPIALNETGDYYVASIDLTDYTELDGYDPVMPTYFVVDAIESYLKRFESENEVTDLDSIAPENGKFYRFSDTSTMKIFPYLTEAEAEVDMIITLSMKPSDGETEVADKFFNDWREAILALAKSKLQTIPKRDWTDYEQAGINMRRYKDERSAINMRRHSFSKLKTRYSQGYI
jgi:hypothetical protein